MRIDHYLQSLPPDTGEHSDPELLRALDRWPSSTTAARVWVPSTLRWQRWWAS
jgi:hypothetical protein